MESTKETKIKSVPGKINGIILQYNPTVQKLNLNRG
jgi:hypothetical protein